ncbi:hypothetical protein [Streptomyces sp. KR80]|uniref:hypothetical protein n=1 Tax=Streptomyces sp. KR80 TaxID=3457426 RepID=UPI003FD55F44
MRDPDSRGEDFGDCGDAGDVGDAGDAGRTVRTEGTGPDRAPRPVEAESADEQLLRLLLEGAVPQLPASAQRMERVRERVRRRRRRAVGGGVAAVVAVALAGVLVPGAVRDGTAPGPAPAPAPPASAPAPDEGSWARYPDLAGLSLRLPRSWGGLVVPGMDDGRHATAGFAAAQPMTRYGQPCTEAEMDFCAPIQGLERGGALLALRLHRDYLSESSGKARGSTDPVAVELGRFCVLNRGTQELAARIDVGGSEGVWIDVHMCLNEPSVERLNQVREIVRSARFGGPGRAVPGSSGQ